MAGKEKNFRQQQSEKINENKAKKIKTTKLKMNKNN